MPKAVPALSGRPFFYPKLVGTRQFEFALLKKEQQEALDSLLRDRFSNMDVWRQGYLG